MKKILLVFALLMGIVALSKNTGVQVATILPPDPEAVRLYVAELPSEFNRTPVAPSTMTIEQA